MNKRRFSLFKVITPFQRWFIFQSLIHALALAFTISLGMYLWIHFLQSELLAPLSSLSPTLGRNIERSLSQGKWIAVILFFAWVAMMTIQSLIFSRRVAGPIFALLRHLEKVESQKQWIPFTLRTGDPFQELPKKLENAFLSARHPQAND